MLKDYHRKTKEELLNDEYYVQFVADSKVKKKETVNQWLARIKQEEYYKNLEEK
jgi:hypothetical protein